LRVPPPAPAARLVGLAHRRIQDASESGHVRRPCRRSAPSARIACRKPCRRSRQTTELPIEWHLIGHLQSNKARKAVGPFTLIHSVDSLGLLERIDAAASEQQLVQRVLVQVDLAQEATKFGAPVDEVRAMLRAAPRLSHVRIDGLMLIPPACDDPEAARPWFTQLRQLRDGFVAAGLAGTGLPELSMGMSHDVEVAIEEGATLVRVGSAIFGSRT
jgi:hypothetical protein